MIRRALLIAGGAVALSAAGALAFTPDLARAGRSWSRDILRSAFGLTDDPQSLGRSLATGGALQKRDVAQGAFCPVRPTASAQPASLPANPEARMSTDPSVYAPVDSSPSVADSLLASTPAICLPKPETTPAQSSAGP